MTRIRAAALVVTGTLVLIGTGCGAGAPPTPAARPGASSPTPTVTPTVTAPVRIPGARRAPSDVVAEPPSLVTLPSGRQVPVRAAGTTATGLLDVPDDVDRAGWWRGGARLGDPFGASVVASHVDSRSQGLGPFAELLTVTRGARVRVDSAHLSQLFEVQSRQLVPQGSLAGEAWIFDSAGEPRLTLVTCAPPYEATRGGYQNLAVVIAIPVSPVERS